MKIPSRRREGGVFIRARATPVFLWMVAATGLLSFALALSRMGWIPARLPFFLAWYAAGFLAYLLGCIVALRTPAIGGGSGSAQGSTRRISDGAGKGSDGHAGLLFVFGVAIAARLLIVGTVPSLSEDIYRYVWDGRVASSGVNPFRYAPDAQALAPLRDSIYEHVTYKSIPTIYGPVCQAVFWIAAKTLPGVTGLKLWLLLFDLGSGVLVALLLRRRGRSVLGAVLYLWNPLVLVEVAGSGHCDPVGIFFLLLALFFAERVARNGGDKSKAGSATLAVVSGVLSALTKFVPAPALPVLWQRKVLISLLGTIALALILYAPYLGPDLRTFGGLREYATRWRSNDSVFALIYGRAETSAWPAAVDHVLATRAGKEFVGDRAGTEREWDLRYRLMDPLLLAKLVAVFLYGVIWLVVLAVRIPTATKLSLLIGALLILSPTLHPWYLLWMIPFLALAPSASWLLLSATVFLAYAPLPWYEATGRWVENPWMKALEYVPFFLLLLFDLSWMGRTRRSTAGAR